MDSRSLFLTANGETVYAIAWLDLSEGPVVVESPPGVLGLVDDFWFHYVADMGWPDPTTGRAAGSCSCRPATRERCPTRGTTSSGPRPTATSWRCAASSSMVTQDRLSAAIKEHVRIYPLAQSSDPPSVTFVNVSGEPMNTIHAMDFSFFEEVNQLVQEEPNAAMDPETLGLLASIGIEHGRPFAPDERMKAILTEAAAVGGATARANAYRCRLEDAYLYPDSAWCTPFVGGSHEFLRDGVRLLDARAFMFFYATGITPAMAARVVGAGSAYAGAFVDSAGRPFDGARTYRLTLPPDVPARTFWSLVLYDTQTRSMLQTDQQFPSIGSQNDGLVTNPDGSTDLYFAPEPPPDHESNWLQTWPEKGWTVILRLYGPEQAWFDQTWRPAEIELLD